MGVLRIGQGFDVHPFAPGIPLWLAGVHVPHERGLLGHSDGDAVCHALIDALLGAAAAGDIGAWFPSTDARWRGARSADLLRHVSTTLEQQDWRVENVDVTVVAQEPRLGPHRDAMRNALADALNIELDRVSVKATTTNGLGPIAQGDGIAALAVALLSRVESSGPS